MHDASRHLPSFLAVYNRSLRLPALSPEELYNTNYTFNRLHNCRDSSENCSRQSCAAGIRFQEIPYYDVHILYIRSIRSDSAGSAACIQSTG